jgi:hypothetical protein
MPREYYSHSARSRRDDHVCPGLRVPVTTLMAASVLLFFYLQQKLGWNE